MEEQQVKEEGTKKKSALDKKLEELNKKYGAGTLITGNKALDNLEVVSSGSLTLDIATGIGGIPIGRLLEIFGFESTGKSTLTLHIIAEFQKAGKKCALIDCEHSFDKKYSISLGVNPSDLIISQPECMEDAYNIIEELIKTGEISLIVFDSHSAALPKAVVNGEVGSATIALQARINSIGLGKIHPLLSKYNCTVISPAQLRTAIGCVSPKTLVSWKK